MDNNLSLSQIFQQRIFRIPDYQRGYAWQNTQLSDFWDDLINLAPNRKHYTGLISWKVASENEIENLNINEKSLCHNGFKLYYIVDGQQRLTTSLILLMSIINFFRTLPQNQNIDESLIFLGIENITEIKKKYICVSLNAIYDVYLLDYEKNNPNSLYLLHNIFGKKYPGSIDESYYTKNLMNARIFFQTKIREYFERCGSNSNVLNELYRKLTNNFIFYTQDINDDYDVCVAFETMNNRGKSLSNLELLKNRLIYLTTLFSNEDLGENSEGVRVALRQNINDTWKEIYKQLGKKSERLLSDDEFLRAHWIIYYTYSRTNGNDYIDFLLNKFSCKSIYRYDGISPKVSTEYLAFQSNIYPERNIDNEDEDDSDALSQKNFTCSRLTYLDINNYVQSLKDIVPYWFYSFYPKDCEKLSIVEQDWIQRLNYIGISYFRPLVAVAIRDDQISEDDRIKLFKAIERFIFVNFRLAQYFSNYKSSEFYRAAKKLYYNEITAEQITHDLEKYTNQNLSDALMRFTSKIDGLFKDGKGFYGWNNLKYFLYEYEEHLVKQEERKMTWETLQSKDTLEHILPQDYSDPYWLKTYQAFSEPQMFQLLSSLGNFLVLSRSANSTLQNYGFPTKKEKRYCKGSYSELEIANRSASNPNDWTAQDIHSRGLQLLQFMNNEWKLGMSDEMQERLLHLDFLNSNNHCSLNTSVSETHSPM